MKPQYLYNNCEIRMIGLSKRDGETALQVFKHFAEGFEFKLQSIHSPSTLCDMKLVGGDRDDFIALVDMTYDHLQDMKLKQMMESTETSLPRGK
jgi:hypothetical protein